MADMRTKGGLIGAGAYGRVYKATGIVDGVEKNLAIKRNIADRGVCGTQNVRELSMLTHFSRHTFPHVIQLKNVHFDGLPFEFLSPIREGRVNSPVSEKYHDDNVHFEFDLALGDLRGLSAKSLGMPRVTSVELKSIMYQMAAATYFIHCHDIVHRDIKPCNWLVYDEPHALPGPKIKMIDFGLSYFVNAQGEQNSPRGIMTQTYRPPEVCLEDPNYNSTIDVWSLGCCFYQLCARGRNIMTPSKNFRKLGDDEDNPDSLLSITEAIPFYPTASDKAYILDHPLFAKNIPDATQKSIRNALNALRRPASMLAEFSEDRNFLAMLEGMLTLNPERRLTSAEVFQHPFFASLRRIESFPGKLQRYQPDVYTIGPGKYRDLMLEVFEELHYTGVGVDGNTPSTRQFIHVHEFCSRILMNSDDEVRKGAKKLFCRNFVYSVYYTFDKILNCLRVNSPSLCISLMTEELEIDDAEVLKMEQDISYLTCGDYYRPTLFERRETASLSDMWNFMWNHGIEVENMVEYLRDFDEFVREENAKDDAKDDAKEGADE